MNRIFDFFDIETVTVDTKNINLSNSKLNPSFYSSNQAFINGLKTKPLDELCEDIFNPPVFKREFIDDATECRYFASAEISSLEPEINFITNEQADRLNLRVRKNWILITGFGTIGNIRIVDKIIENYAVANNVARIVPKQNLIGFIAAFLSSNYGKKLLNDFAAGAVVKYIEAPQISQIPIPILSEEIIEKTNEFYLKTVRCREEAHTLLDKAKSLVLTYNHLPPLEEAELETLDPDKETDLRLVSSAEFTDDFRLDAHFYNPMAALAVRNIREKTSNFQELFKSAESIFMRNRFSRNYVEKEQGLPFLSGKNIIQIRPEQKYISLTETNEIDELRVKKGWILITRSGTLGRVGFVWNNYEDYTATEDIIRVSPNENIDPGYLYSFLSSEYGYHQIIKYKHGAVIDHITPEQIADIVIPIPNENEIKEIGDLVRQAYDLRAEAIRLEDEAQEILTKALTGK